MPKVQPISMRQARLGRGWSQLELSKRAGVHPAMVAAIECGQTPGRLIILHKIADALGYPLRQVFPDAFNAAVEAYNLAVAEGRAAKEKVDPQKPAQD